MRAIKVPANVGLPITIVDTGTKWHELAKEIGGPCNYIEVARSTLDEHGLVLVVDEEGIFNGQPVNPRSWSLMPHQLLHGDVLVMAEGRTDEGTDLIDLPDPALALQLVKELEL